MRLPAPTLDRVASMLRRIRLPVAIHEVDLHARVAAQLRNGGVPFEPEYRLGPRERIDFLTDGGVGIECKRGHPNGPALLRQLERYAAHREVRALLVVLPWKKHVSVPDEIGGKPVMTLSLNELWGVAL